MDAKDRRIAVTQCLFEFSFFSDLEPAGQKNNNLLGAIVFAKDQKQPNNCLFRNNKPQNKNHEASL